MDFLARREHSFFELQQKLSRKFPDADEEMLEAVLAALRSENLQSDERFVESYVRYRKSRGFGMLHILADLQSRKVGDEFISRHLFADDEDWLHIAEELTERRLGDIQVEFGSKAHKKHLRFLQSRGFSPREIRAVLDKRVK
jgi:regulatory protein